jgi:hypothetical protein
MKDKKDAESKKGVKSEKSDEETEGDVEGDFEDFLSTADKEAVEWVANNPSDDNDDPESRTVTSKPRRSDDLCSSMFVFVSQVGRCSFLSHRCSCYIQQTRGRSSAFPSHSVYRRGVSDYLKHFHSFLAGICARGASSSALCLPRLLQPVLCCVPMPKIFLLWRGLQSRPRYSRGRSVV